MIRVITQVQLQDDPAIHDLELPAEIGAGELAMLVSTTMGWNTDGSPFHIYSPARDRRLRWDESLADAGLWDGSLVVVRPEQPEQLGPGAEDPTERELAYLVSIATNRRYSLTSSHATLGRGGKPPNFCDLSREPGHQGISRQHASIALADDRWTLTPTRKSRNATLINGKVITRGVPHELESGDEIDLAGCKFTFGTSGA